MMGDWKAGISCGAFVRRKFGRERIRGSTASKSGRVKRRNREVRLVSFEDN
jgi:hypothetical protein